LPTINYISPNGGDLGTQLNVYISGSDFDFYDYSSSQYSSLQFVHSDYSSSGSSFTGNIYSSSSGIAYAQLSIPGNIDEGYYDVEIFDLGSENWIILENGFYLEQGPMIESISPNEGYQGESLEVNISGLNMSFENYSGSYSHLRFYHSDYSNTYYNFLGGYAYDLSDNEAWFNVNIPSEAPEGMYDVRVYDYNSYNYVWLYDGFEVLVNNDPCTFWNIENVTYWNENSSLFYEFDDDSDTINIELCTGVQIFYANPSSIQNTQFLYWNNDVVFENNFSEIFIENDTILSIYYDDGDTSCLVKTYNFNVFESVQDVAEVSVTNNSCFGIDDGQITLTSQERFNSFYYESNFFFIDNQDILNLIPYIDIDSYSLYEDTFIVNNPNNISEIYFYDLWNSNNGCILDFNFDTELPQANYYILPFEESFDSGMPCDWNNDSHWSFGNVSDVLGPYWDIPAHNQFAVSNDDACDCDMMQDRLITPPLIIDNLEGDISLSFSAFFTGDYGSIANIEISNDMGTSWQNISVLTPSNDWQDLSFNISDYITSETIQLAFRHSDSHSWGSGFAIDDVFVDFQCLDSDNDEVCDFDEVLGCTDVLANNFDELATEDDGSCLIDVYGCTYAAAFNFNSEANIDDGSCYFTLDGCTDPFAINFNDLANIDDGSCEYSSIDDNPCDITPSGLSVDNIIHNRVTFNWSAPSAAPSYYMIRYRVVGTSSWTVMTAGPVNSNEFTGTSRTRYFMEPGTTYEWNIRARVLNEDGSTNCQSAWSTSNEYTTLDACANLENLSISTEAVWATLSADAPAAEWGVWQSKGKMRVVGTNSFRYVNGDENGNISSLKGNFTPSTDYEWHTKAWCTGNVDSEGNSDPMYHSGWGDFSSFTTEALCDKMPTNLSTSANGAQTAITMSWDTPESGEPDHYFLELTNVTTGQVWAWNNISGSDNSKTKFGLTAGDYSWRIRGACGTNGTSWATIFSQPVDYTLGGARLENSSVANLDVYPNPSRDIFNVTFTSEEAQTMTVKVVNMTGEEIFTEELTEFVGQYTQVIDMNTQPKGIYFLEITTSKGGINKKVALQ
ncbi:fibronectin type III domain-containing protein, partial [Flavobacteriales bacterium]|nr:fibronectin type III domain-containing protein [Flavobacteriales bacterium]